MMNDENLLDGYSEFKENNQNLDSQDAAMVQYLKTKGFQTMSEFTESEK